MPEQQTQQDAQYAQYDPVEALPSAWVLPIVFTNTQVAASGAKINTHVPTPDEIAKRKYVLRLYRPGPRWFRWLFGTGEYSPK